MMVFEDIQELRDWLAPLDYIAFWQAIEPYRLTLHDRDACDAQIARGGVPQALVLKGLKTLARIELTERFGLTHATPEPLAARTLGSLH